MTYKRIDEIGVYELIILAEQAKEVSEMAYRRMREVPGEETQASSMVFGALVTLLGTVSDKATEIENNLRKIKEEN